MVARSFRTSARVLGGKAAMYVRIFRATSAASFETLRELGMALPSMA
jgi:hypothetical protein